MSKLAANRRIAAVAAMCGALASACGGKSFAGSEDSGSGGTNPGGSAHQQRDCLQSF